MAWWLAALVLFGMLTGFFAIGLPVAFAFLGINVVGAWVWLGQDAGLVQMIRNGVASIASFSLTPIPFFILMGEILFHTGVAMKAIDAIDRLIWRVPGRLSVVAVVADTEFSAISGSTSALTVLLGSLAGISISQLLVAGIVPGVLLSILFVGYIVLRTSLDPTLAPPFEGERVTGWARWWPLVIYVLPLLLIFTVVVLAMSAGWATPTESAAVGAVATALIATLYRSLTWPSLLKALLGTAGISGIILLIIVGATTFSQILAFSGATNGLVNVIREA